MHKSKHQNVNFLLGCLGGAIVWGSQSPYVSPRMEHFTIEWLHSTRLHLFLHPPPYIPPKLSIDLCAARAARAYYSQENLLRHFSLYFALLIKKTMKFLMYFLMAINAQRYTSLLNRANQKRQRQKPVTETQRPMYYGNSYSHEPHGQRNSNSYGNVHILKGCFNSLNTLHCM